MSGPEKWAEAPWGSKRNQSYGGMFCVVQGRRSLGSRRLERCGFWIHPLWFRCSVGRFLAGTSCYAAEIVGSVILILGYVAGLYVASVAMVLSFAFFISGAWLLITGIHDKQD